MKNNHKSPYKGIGCPNGSSATIPYNIRLDSTVTNRPALNEAKQKLFKKYLSTPSHKREIVKVIVTGKIIQEYYFSRGVYIKTSKDSKFKVRDTHPRKKRKSKRNPEYRLRTANKALNKLIRVAQASFSEDPNTKFLTLTFNNSNPFDITDISICNHYFSLFIKRLKKIIGELKYIKVAEYQQRGAVHFHVIISTPFIEKEELTKIWSYGFIDIRTTVNCLAIGAYLAKYMTKNATDERFAKKRSYVISRTCCRPQVFYGEKAMLIKATLDNNQIKPTFVKPYWSDKCGMIFFKEYNLYKTNATSAQSNKND